MMSWFRLCRQFFQRMRRRQWFAPPVFHGDEEKTRRAGLLNTALLNVAVLLPILWIGNLLGGKLPPSVWIANLLTLGALALLRYWVLRGRVLAASLAFLAAGLILITFSLASLGTVRSPTAALFVLIVGIAGLLFDRRGTIVAALLSSAVIAVMIFAENANLLPPADYTVTITQWFTYAVIFAGSGSLAYHTARIERQALQRANNEIAARLQAEGALQESETRFRSLTQHSPAAICLTDLRRQCLYANDRWLAMTGMTPDEALGDGWRFGLHPDDRERVAEAWEEMIASQGRWGLEYRLQTPSGKTTWVMGYAAELVNALHQTTGYMSVNIDISERKEAEAALQTAAREWNATFDAVTDAIWLLDTHQIILRSNRAAETLFHKTDAEIVGHPCWEIVHGGESPIADCPFPRMLQSLKRETMELQSGGRWLEVDVDPLFGEDGALAGAIHIVRDITESALARQKVHQSEQYYRTLIETSPDAVMQFDLHGKILFGNQQAAELYGFESLDELVGRSGFEMIAPQDHPRARADLQTVITDGLLQEAEYTFIKRDQTKIAVSVSAAVSRDAAGRPDSVITLVRDVTQRKFREAAAQARARLVSYSLDHSLDETLQFVLDEAEAQTESCIGFFHFMEADQQTLWLQNWSTHTLRDFCKAEGKGAHYSVDQAGVWVDCIHQRRAVIHNDYGSLPHRKGLPPGHAVVLREAVVPIFRGEKIVGILGVGNKPQEYTDQDIEVLNEMADLSWDIVVRKQAEQALKRSLEEKEVLMRELQHRVKNSLSVVSSLLALGMQELPDERSRAIFVDARERIHSMAAIYEQLYRERGLDRVDLGLYTQRLVEGLSLTYLPPGAPVTVDVQTESLFVDLKRALSLSLIINELFLNALKHAFPPGRSGAIRVTLITEGANATLQVADDGVGMGEAQSPASQGMGLKLVDMLASQIGGHVELLSERGVTARLTFGV